MGSAGCGDRCRNARDPAHAVSLRSRVRAGFRQVYDARFMPDGPLETGRAFDELQRLSTTPQNVYRLWRAFGDLDASADAAQLPVPTLILHSKDDQVWSFSEAEELHSLPGSKLVGLDSNNHILRADEPALASSCARCASSSPPATPSGPCEAADAVSTKEPARSPAHGSTTWTAASRRSAVPGPRSPAGSSRFCGCPAA